MGTAAYPAHAGSLERFHLVLLAAWDTLLTAGFDFVSKEDVF